MITNIAKIDTIAKNDMAEFACKLDEVIKVSKHDKAMKMLLVWLRKDYLAIWDEIEGLVEEG